MHDNNDLINSVSYNFTAINIDHVIVFGLRDNAAVIIIYPSCLEETKQDKGKDE
jgi:hypothetical protein